MDVNSIDNGIRDKDRVKSLGEVFTPDSIVNDMLDLIDKSDEWKDLPTEEYITKSYLEPSCGNGQFLIRILYRKLERVKKLPIEQRQLALIKSLCTIYGVDIDDINVRESRERMLRVATGQTEKSFDLGDKPDAEIKVDLEITIDEQLEEVIKFILKNNIICGNTLVPRISTGDGDSKMSTVHILLSEYTFNNEDVTVKQYPLDDLENSTEVPYPTVNYMNLPSLNLELKHTFIVEKPSEEDEEVEDY